VLNSFKALMNLQNWQLDRQLTVLGVSGGLDSMVLLNVFVQNKWPCVVAHVNFGLRGEESLGDTDFVQNECQKLGVQCHVKFVNTEKIAIDLGVSIQMAARDIRYAFFDEVLHSTKAQSIATAHHQDDELENFFIYLMRNEMHTAWLGIPETRGHIIRPFLHIPRQIIAEFAAENAISWREDSSNAKTKYLRNKIRHLLLPSLKEEFPTIATDYQLITQLNRDQEKQYLEQFDVRWLQFVKQSEGEINVPQNFVNEKQNVSGLLRKFRFMGFSESQILQALSVTQRVGSFWESAQWRLVKNRDGLTVVLHELSDGSDLTVCIDSVGEVSFADYLIEIQYVENSNVQYNLNNMYYFDASILEGNLWLRHWKEGDKMQVLGMEGRKKLSDLFVDSKVDLLSKQKLPILILDDQILAVLSLRRSGLHLVNDKNRVVSISWKLK
jgi:tRNA(Ile)-lysidine synthase